MHRSNAAIVPSHTLQLSSVAALEVYELSSSLLAMRQLNSADACLCQDWDNPLAGANKFKQQVWSAKLLGSGTA